MDFPSILHRWSSGKWSACISLPFFIVWQVINLIAFRTFPNLPIVLGGTLIIERMEDATRKRWAAVRKAAAKKAKPVVKVAAPKVATAASYYPAAGGV